mmetsp:Transcript_125214/g.401110  ORF Transcript_125214/g.401110 Transcript_125214/m.401110 type:complete len:392 (+) Transcript_125214:1434-2609(+)
MVAQELHSRLGVLRRRAIQTAGLEPVPLPVALRRGHAPRLARLRRRRLLFLLRERQQRDAPSLAEAAGQGPEAERRRGARGWGHGHPAIQKEGGAVQVVEVAGAVCEGRSSCAAVLRVGEHTRRAQWRPLGARHGRQRRRRAVRRDRRASCRGGLGGPHWRLDRDRPGNGPRVGDARGLAQDRPAGLRGSGGQQGRRLVPGSGRGRGAVVATGRPAPLLRRLGGDDAEAALASSSSYSSSSSATLRAPGPEVAGRARARGLAGSFALGVGFGAHGGLGGRMHLLVPSWRHIRHRHRRDLGHGDALVAATADGVEELAEVAERGASGGRPRDLGSHWWRPEAHKQQHARQIGLAGVGRPVLLKPGIGDADQARRLQRSCAWGHGRWSAVAVY